VPTGGGARQRVRTPGIASCSCQQCEATRGPSWQYPDEPSARASPLRGACQSTCHGTCDHQLCRHKSRNLSPRPGKHLEQFLGGILASSARSLGGGDETDQSLDQLEWSIGSSGQDLTLCMLLAFCSPSAARLLAACCHGHHTLRMERRDACHAAREQGAALQASHTEPRCAAREFPWQKKDDRLAPSSHIWGPTFFVMTAIAPGDLLLTDQIVSNQGFCKDYVAELSWMIGELSEQHKHSVSG